MPASATEGTILAKLIALAGPLCRAAQRALPRRGRGAPPEYPDWKIAVLITVAVTARRKSKSAQYRFLNERRVGRKVGQEICFSRFLNLPLSYLVVPSISGTY